MYKQDTTTVGYCVFDWPPTDFILAADRTKSQRTTKAAILSNLRGKFSYSFNFVSIQTDFSHTLASLKADYENRGQNGI